MDYQMDDVPDRASRASSIPHHSLSHAANDEFFSGCPSLESPLLSQQWHVAFPSERGVQAELPIGRPPPSHPSRTLYDGLRQPWSFFTSLGSPDAHTSILTTHIPMVREDAEVRRESEAQCFRRLEVN